MSVDSSVIMFVYSERRVFLLHYVYEQHDIPFEIKSKQLKRRSRVHANSLAQCRYIDEHAGNYVHSTWNILQITRWNEQRRNVSEVQSAALSRWPSLALAGVKYRDGCLRHAIEATRPTTTSQEQKMWESNASFFYMYVNVTRAGLLCRPGLNSARPAPLILTQPQYTDINIFLN